MPTRKEKKTREEIEASVARFTEVVRAITSVILSLIKGATIVGCLYIVYLIASNFAGKETTASIGLQVIADLKANQWFGYIVGGGGLVYGLSERKIRQRNIKRLAERTDKLEKTIDPNKSSSYLTLAGEARLEDA